MLFKNNLLALSLIAGILFFGSCKKTDETATLTIQVTSDENVSDYSKFTVEIKELRTLKIITKELDAKGTCQVTVDKGTYTLSAGWQNVNVKYFGTKENYSVTQSETVNIKVVRSVTKPEGLVFKEIFFNGETNNGQMMHPDQYFVLYNNGDETVYADGVTFSVSAHANWSEADVFTALLPGEVVAAQFYSIPGNGKDYPVEPGKQIVVARTAIDHSKEYENAVDLSGADFEIYEPDMPAQYGTDVDNPDVPNLIAHFSVWGIFSMHPRGPLAPFIFIPETDMKTFMENNKFEYKTKKGETKFTYKVPAGLIIDGIETGNEGFLKVKSLPASVDQGSITVTGCHRQELIRRKAGQGHKLQDTNNSSVDCERVKGQTSFPKKQKSYQHSGILRRPITTSSYYKQFPCGVDEFENSSSNILR